MPQNSAPTAIDPFTGNGLPVPAPGELIELRRDRFTATMTEAHNHRVNGDHYGAVIVGPVLIDVVHTRYTRPDGTVCRPSVSVEIDGRHAFGWCGMYDAQHQDSGSHLSRGSTPWLRNVTAA